MIGLVKKCRSLKIDRFGVYYCSSCHVCYRTVCESNMFVTVLHLGSNIHTIRNEQIKY
nr:MAG TPA: protein of unknown function (DUF1924) [Caudoviricetes sp.]